MVPSATTATKLPPGYPTDGNLPDGVSILPGFSVSSGAGSIDFGIGGGDDGDPWADLRDNGEDWGDDSGMVVMDGPLDNPGHTTFDTLMQQVLKMKKKQEDSSNKSNILEELERQAMFWAANVRKSESEDGQSTIWTMKDQYSDRKIKITLQPDPNAVIPTSVSQQQDELLIAEVKATPREDKFSRMDKMINGIEGFAKGDTNAREFITNLANEVGMKIFQENECVLVARDDDTGNQVRIGIKEDGALDFMGFDWAD